MPAWPSIRALLITLSLAVGLVAGLPVPMSERAAQRHPELARFAVRVAQAQGVVLAPFRFIGNAFVLTQRWKLFSGADTALDRLWVEELRGAPGEEFRVLYRAHDPEHAYAHRLIEYRRVRGAWNASGESPRASYAAFARWISRRILRERPESSAVRVRMELIEVLPRGRGFEPTGRFVRELVYGREELP
jgi:hypothetical protein